MTDNFIFLPQTLNKPKRVSNRKGRWSAEEQIKFREGLELFGRNWKKIQAFVKSRSLLQIRSHAQKYFIMQQRIEKRKKKIKKAIVE